METIDDAKANIEEQICETMSNLMSNDDGVTDVFKKYDLEIKFTLTGDTVTWTETGYQYVITHNYIDDLGKVNTDKDISKLPYKFRLLDDDGEVYFEGQSNDSLSECAFIPLDEIGNGYGCTDVQYFEDGKWVSL